VEGLIGRTLGSYRLLEQIGQGGMSSVYRAEDLRGPRQVAVKILSPLLAPEAHLKERFEREIRLLLRLRHPHIVPILDFGEADEMSFIVMPFVPSGTLHDRLRRGPIDLQQGARLIDQVASALSYAHANGVVHRDVKPSNVLLDRRGNALLSDFSFARPQDVSQDLTGSALIGTPAYISPEQCRGEPIDQRSDQYSLAVMVFQITTGQLPFEGDTPLAIAMQHVNVPLPRPRALNPSLSVEVEQVLIRALAKDPSLRFESVEAMNRAFQAAVTASLEPRRQAAEDPTIITQRTLAMYRKYQHVRPTTRRARLARPAVAAALLLILVFVVSAGAVAVLRPEVLGPRTAVPTVEDPSVKATHLQATVDYMVILGSSDQPTGLPVDALETEVVVSAMQTIQAASAATATAEAGAP
jgi:serine/threonine-protein kinase